jgi:hypothetical protein
MIIRGVLMMGIGIMLMGVGYRLMMVHVGVNCAGCDRIRVLVLVMLIVDMFVLVVHCLMDMRMDVLFREMKPQSERHHSARGQEFQADGFMQERNRKNSAKERSHGEIRSGAGRAEMA